MTFPSLGGRTENLVMPTAGNRVRLQALWQTRYPSTVGWWGNKVRSWAGEAWERLPIRRGRWIARGLVAVALFMLASAITGDRGLVRIHALREELREVDGHNFDLMQSANRLQSQLDRLETDAELERLARKQLLVRDGETLYQFADAAQRRDRADTKHR